MGREGPAAPSDARPWLCVSSFCNRVLLALADDDNGHKYAQSSPQRSPVHAGRTFSSWARSPSSSLSSCGRRFQRKYKYFIRPLLRACADPPGPCLAPAAEKTYENPDADPIIPSPAASGERSPTLQTSPASSRLGTSTATIHGSDMHYGAASPMPLVRVWAGSLLTLLP